MNPATEPTTAEPKPCPFCGHELLRHAVECVSNTGGNTQYAYCPLCSAHGPWGKGRERAIELWNTRALNGKTDASEDAMPGYRMLKVGEVIQEGDEYRAGFGEWTKAQQHNGIGCVWGSDRFVPFRRPLTSSPAPTLEDEATPLTDAAHKHYNYRSAISGLIYANPEACGGVSETLVYVPADFARTLERKLAIAQAQSDNWQARFDTAEAANNAANKEYAQKLEEARQEVEQARQSFERDTAEMVRGNEINEQLRAEVERLTKKLGDSLTVGSVFYELVKQLVADGECYCTPEGSAVKSLCGHCEAKAFLEKENDLVGLYLTTLGKRTVECISLRADLATLAARLKAVEEDKERLDWLEKQVSASGYSTSFVRVADFVDGKRHGPDWCVVTTLQGSGPGQRTFKGIVTARAAIDAAKQKEKV